VSVLVLLDDSALANRIIIRCSLFLKNTMKRSATKKRRKMDLYEHRLALEEKRAHDDRASRQMQHEVMMTLIVHLNDNNNK
jgi:hypothetical protein